MKKIKFVFIICFIFLITGNLFSQYDLEVTKVGTNAATFLEIGVGARAMAMGSAYAAVANDATALYYNPAGIVWLNGVQVEFMHNQWFADTKHDFVGAVLPLNRIAFGLSFISLDYGEQPVRTESRPEGTGEKWGARDYAIALSFGLALTDRFSFGASAKYISQRVWHNKGHAGAIDLGIFYNTQIKGLRIAMAMSNFGNQIQLRGRDLDTTKDPDEDHENIDRVPAEYKTGAYTLPLLFRAGISYERQMGMLGSFLVCADVNHPSNSTEFINVGFEYGFAGIFFLRCGYESLFEENAENGLTYGGGIDYYKPGRMGFRIDYAYNDWGLLDNSQRFSVGIQLPF